MSVREPYSPNGGWTSQQRMLLERLDAARGEFVDLRGGDLRTVEALTFEGMAHRAGLRGAKITSHGESEIARIRQTEGAARSPLVERAADKALSPTQIRALAGIYERGCVPQGVRGATIGKLREAGFVTVRMVETKHYPKANFGRFNMGSRTYSDPDVRITHAGIEFLVSLVDADVADRMRNLRIAVGRGRS